MITHLSCTPLFIIILLGDVYQFHSRPPLLLLVKYTIALIDVNYFSTVSDYTHEISIAERSLLNE